MFSSRRGLLATLAAASCSTVAAAATRSSPGHGDNRRLHRQVLSAFESLPGTKALKIWAPATNAKEEILIEHNASEKLFVGSAIKAFVLAERLRQLDSPNVVQTLMQKELLLDQSVWSADSQMFNPPHLTGTVTERTAMEAMIIHSDNTATDMEFLQAGPDNVRKFLSFAGLNSSLVPDSTRVFFGYLLGAANYKTFSWNDLSSSPDDAPIVNAPLNSVETLASSADDFVSFYSRALHGAFFRYAETLGEFRRILSLGDVISLVPFPLGASSFAKGGSIDVPGSHALCIPGGFYLNHRWIYITAIINWDSSATQDQETVNLFLKAVRQIVALVEDAVSED